MCRFIETHSKTYTNALAIFLSIGGWFLWNIILSSLYKSPSTIYYVRDTFLRGFGASLTWWLCLIIILLATIVFEVGVQSLRAAYFTTDEDVFQALEKDPAVKRRFEEASAAELQAGWDRRTNREKDEQMKVKEVVQRVQAKEEERREKEVKEILRKRVGTGEFERNEGRAREEDGGDVDRVLSRGYGDVRMK